MNTLIIFVLLLLLMLTGMPISMNANSRMKSAAVVMIRRLRRRFP